MRERKHVQEFVTYNESLYEILQNLYFVDGEFVSFRMSLLATETI